MSNVICQSFAKNWPEGQWAQSEGYHFWCYTISIHNNCFNSDENYDNCNNDI